MPLCDDERDRDTAMTAKRHIRTGIALGSGASRGWSHVGVLKALVRAGIEPDVVCGTSVGAMVGAAYLAGNLEKLEEWVLGSSQLDLIRFFGIQNSRAGFVDTDRFRAFLDANVVAEGREIGDLPRSFATIATDVLSGREVWLTEGDALTAVQASMALPGLFPAVRLAERWLVDGGLVNPVPVSVCHALGADFVVAVNLNADILGKRDARRETGRPEEDGILHRLKRFAAPDRESSPESSKSVPPGTFDVVANSINIFQDRITRSRLAGDPPDVMITPKLAHIGLLDFNRAEEAIREGEERASRVLEEIKAAFGQTGS